MSDGTTLDDCLPPSSGDYPAHRRAWKRLSSPTFVRALLPVVAQCLEDELGDDERADVWEAHRHRLRSWLDVGLNVLAAADQSPVDDKTRGDLVEAAERVLDCAELASSVPDRLERAFESLRGRWTDRTPGQDAWMWSSAQWFRTPRPPQTGVWVALCNETDDPVTGYLV